jgi:prepilin-type N-terminal cleavage/methylation domain-containing protein
MTRPCLARKSAAAGIRGFSLVEVLMALAILGFLCGAIFLQIEALQQRNRTEQVKLDSIQQVRDFEDQFFRDINQVGYPNGRMIDTSSALWNPALSNPLVNDRRLAAGIVKIDSNEIWFEGDLNGNGTVQSVHYMVNGSGACTACLQRSQVDKATGSPTGQAQNWGTEINDVANTTIFSYFDTTGIQIPASKLPLDISTAAGAQTIATIKTVQMNLRITNPLVVDPKTRQPIEMTFQGEIAINNCSLAANFQPMSCF